MAPWPSNLMAKQRIAGEGVQPTLYSCKQRTAFHVHYSFLLRNSFTEYRQGLSSVEKKQALEDELEGASDIDLQDKKTLSCADAIAKGRQEMKRGKYEVAIEAFTIALSVVSADSECTQLDSLMQVCASPSEQEEETALYNLACCYSKLGELDSGLAVLRGLLELPCFHNFDILRHTPDLQELRSTWGFVALLREFDQGATIQVGGDYEGSSFEDPQYAPMAEDVVASVP